MDPIPATCEQFVEKIDDIVHGKCADIRMGMVAGPAYVANPQTHARKLERLFAQVQSAFPVISTQMPSGKHWTGTQMPPGWAQAQVLLPTGMGTDPKIRGSLLHLASKFGVRPKWVGWLLASGVDPLKFCEEPGNAPLGQMAYSSDHQSVRVVRRAGFDMSLRLLPEHLDMTDPGHARMAGTTLLHRLVNRLGQMGAADRQVIDEILRSGVSPAEQSLAGQTPIDLCRSPDLREYLQRHLAKTSRKALHTATKPAAAQPAAHRPRF